MRSETAIARVHEATTSVRTGTLRLYAGYGRVVWGRLDELQPTDVINPLDISKFFLKEEKRVVRSGSRGRWHFTDAVSLEAVYVPIFRRGRFDQLDEPTSPFNIVPPFTNGDVTCQAIGCPPIEIPVERLEPSARWDNAQGGARFNATTGTVDWSLSTYRGFESFGLYRLQTGAPIPPFQVPQVTVEQSYPRFTLVGGDFETVVGQWGSAERSPRSCATTSKPEAGVVTGSSVDAGVGFDRKAGDYRFSGTVLYHREDPDEHGSAAPQAG